MTAGLTDSALKLSSWPPGGVPAVGDGGLHGEGARVDGDADDGVPDRAVGERRALELGDGVLV